MNATLDEDVSGGHCKSLSKMRAVIQAKGFGGGFLLARQWIKPCRSLEQSYSYKVTAELAIDHRPTVEL